MENGVIANEEEHGKRQHQLPTSSRPELDQSGDEDDEEDYKDEDDEEDYKDEDDEEDDKDEDDEEDDKDEYEVEKFMVDGIHFSHNHQLSLTISGEEEEEEEMDDDDNFCRIWGLPVFVSTEPAYTCTEANNACKFFLHKQCALKLPPKLTNYPHHPNFNGNHFLRIVSRPSGTNFMTYECRNCNFKIHPLVAVSGVEIKIKHKSHPLHEMVALCKEISCVCDACGKIQHGFFFACHNCNFWIHQDCTTLPNVLTFTDHPHPFILAYSLPYDQVVYYCIVCKEELLVSHNGVYFCPQTSRFAHAACAMEKFASRTNRLQLMQLPDDEFNAFPVSVVLDTMGGPLSPNAHGDDELTIDEYHSHPLILTGQVSNSSTKAWTNLACDLCRRPIPTEVSSPLFYKCKEHCHLFVHKICAVILPNLTFLVPLFQAQVEAEMCGDLSSYMFLSIFHCRFCHRPCNGLCYYIPDRCSSRVVNELHPFFFDLECIAAPATVNHASHAQHILFRSSRVLDVTPLTCCRNDSLIYDVYRCITCKYCIHISCAMLPKTILYLQYHHHPLHLLFTTTTATATASATDHEYEDISSSFCEVCEEGIDLNYWFYRCSDCDQSFHVNCIPSVGRLSKVMFGKTFSLPDSHIHPLKLKRMLTLHTQRCGHCKKFIQGLVDEMAFFCSRCHFWIHFTCAAAAHNKNTSDKLYLYSDFDDDAALITKIRTAVLSE